MGKILIFYGLIIAITIISLVWFIRNVVKIIGEFQCKVDRVPRVVKDDIEGRMTRPGIKTNSAEYRQYEKQLAEITKQNFTYGIVVIISMFLFFVMASVIPGLSWLSGLLITASLCVITLFLLLDPKKSVGIKKIRVLERIALAILVPMSVSIGAGLATSIVMNGTLNLRPVILILLPPLALYLMPRKLARLTVGMKNIFRRRG